MSALWVLALTAGCRGERCDVPETAEELAGSGATSCGTVALGDPLDDAWACAVAAFEAGTPTWFTWEDSGIDSTQVEALVYDGERVWWLSQDQYQRGPWRIDGFECVGPTVGVEPYGSGLTEILCASREPEGNHYEVCGECTGCSPPGLPFPGSPTR